MEQQAQATPQTQPDPQRPHTPERIGNVLLVPAATREESSNTIEVLVSSGLYNPNRVFLPNYGTGEEILGTLETAARNGWADNFARTLLALQQTPAFSPTGTDNVRETSARYTNDALNTPFGMRSNNACLETVDASMEGCRITPISDNDLREVTVAGYVTSPASYMRPGRTFTIVNPSAFMAGFFDAQLNPQRYLPSNPDGTAQNLTPEQNAARVRDAVASENPGVNPDAALRDIAVRCLENSPSVEIRQCAIAGARYSVVFSGENPDVRYNGAQFTGRPPAPAVPTRQ